MACDKEIGSRGQPRPALALSSSPRTVHATDSVMFVARIRPDIAAKFAATIRSGPRLRPSRQRGCVARP